MIRKTFKRNIVLPVADTKSNQVLLSETVWTVDLQGCDESLHWKSLAADKVIDLEIVSCNADLDERQFDMLKEICMNMRNMPAITVELIDESRMENLLSVEPI